MKLEGVVLGLSQVFFYLDIEISLQLFEGMNEDSLLYYDRIAF